MFEPLFDLYMEFYSLEEGEGSVSAHPKTVQEAAVFRRKTFFFEYKQSNLPRGPTRGFTVTNDLHDLCEEKKLAKTKLYAGLWSS